MGHKMKAHNMLNKIILVVYVINSTEVVLLLAQRWVIFKYAMAYLSQKKSVLQGDKRYNARDVYGHMNV